MSDWYCVASGQRYGPVPLETLRAWLPEGRLTPADLVWTEGMSQWLPVSAVAGIMPPGAAIGPGSPPPGWVSPGPTMPPPPPPATGPRGQTPNGQLNDQALEMLRDRWGLAIGFCLLFWLVNAGINMLSNGIATLILGGPLELGAMIFFLTFARGGNAELGLMFSGFKNFGNSLAAYLLVTIFTFLWMLLLIVPGIIAALAYSQTFYLLADEPTLGGLEAIRKSKEMMYGYKAKLFGLWMRYLGWSLLCLLTCGIGFIWLMPYMSCGLTRFYEDLRGAPPSAQPVPIQ